MSEQKLYMTHNEFVLFCMWYYTKNKLKSPFEFSHLKIGEVLFIIDNSWYFGHRLTNKVTLWKSSLKSLNVLYNEFLEEDDIV